MPSMAVIMGKVELVRKKRNDNMEGRMMAAIEIMLGTRREKAGSVRKLLFYLYSGSFCI